MTVVWVLNLDADLELAAPRGYTPSAKVREQVRAASARVGIVSAGEVVVEEGDRLPKELVGATGRAFSMTPRARRILEAAGAVPVDAPSLEVLRRVSSRRWSAELGQTLPGARFASTLAEVHDALAVFAAFADRRVVCKRAHSHAGRGQRRFIQSRMTAAERAWIEASVVLGGLQIEPEVAIEREHATHGYVHAGGRVDVATPKVLRCDAAGQWLETRAAAPGEIGVDDVRASMEEARRVGEALFEAGYFGAFGVDGYCWRDADGGLHTNIRSEVNARYTMSWSL